ncbi:MAG: cytochrome c peroxidase [Holophagaceae bacterium]
MRTPFLLPLVLFLAACGGSGGSGSPSQASSPGGGGSGSAAVAGPNLPATPYVYAAPLPAHLANLQGPGGLRADTTPPDNPVTDAGATLGRVLFHDKHLSANDTVSCGSCHRQAHGFSDPSRLSTGFAGGLTARHAMGLVDARFYARGRFFWDERAPTLEAQVLQPIQNTTEMGMTLPALETKLAALPYYPALFQAAFGSPAVTSDRIAKALAQFVRALVSTQSKYDHAFQGGPPNFAAVFTPQELQGLQLFAGGGVAPGRTLRCDACHGTPAQIAAQPENNGLDATVTDAGAGDGRFKVPSLRNVALRAPYMHDGRFATLDEVIEHYSTGVKDSPTLSPQLRTPPGPNGGQAVRFNLSAEEKAALRAFLETLTDSALATDPKFSDPF